MCDHTKLLFIGYQENPAGDPFPLYNCLDCHTTISIKDPQKQRAAEKRSSLKRQPLEAAPVL